MIYLSMLTKLPNNTFAKSPFSKYSYTFALVCCSSQYLKNCYLVNIEMASLLLHRKQHPFNFTKFQCFTLVIMTTSSIFCWVWSTLALLPLQSHLQVFPSNKMKTLFTMMITGILFQINPWVSHWINSIKTSLA